MPKRKDLTGQRFGRLVALRAESVRMEGRRRVYWLCQCDCGQQTTAQASCLLCGDTRSCGCFRTVVMAAPDELRALRDRVLAATGTDRELDVDVCLALGIDPTHGGEASGFIGVDTVYRFTSGMPLSEAAAKYPDWKTHAAISYRVPEITGSLDAAVALCERVLPGWPWSAYGGGGADPDKPSVNVWPREQPFPAALDVSEEAATLALAFLAATLSALIAQEPDDDRA